MNTPLQAMRRRPAFPRPAGVHSGSRHSLVWRVVAATAIVFCAVAVGTAFYYGFEEARADSQHQSLEAKYDQAAGRLLQIRSQVRDETEALADPRANLRRLEEENAAAEEELAQLRAQIEHLRGEKEALETSR